MKPCPSWLTETRRELYQTRMRLYEAYLRFQAVSASSNSSSSSSNTVKRPHCCTHECDLFFVEPDIYFCCNAGSVHICNSQHCDRRFIDTHCEVCAVTGQQYPLEFSMDAFDDRIDRGQKESTWDGLEEELDEAFETMPMEYADGDSDIDLAAPVDRDPRREQEENDQKLPQPEDMLGLESPASPTLDLLSPEDEQALSARGIATAASSTELVPWDTLPFPSAPPPSSPSQRESVSKRGKSQKPRTALAGCLGDYAINQQQLAMYRARIHEVLRLGNCVLPEAEIEQIVLIADRLWHLIATTPYYKAGSMKYKPEYHVLVVLLEHATKDGFTIDGHTVIPANPGLVGHKWAEKLLGQLDGVRPKTITMHKKRFKFTLATVPKETLEQYSSAIKTLLQRSPVSGPRASGIGT